jgi:superfamily I DNA/RNA helicase
MTTWSKYQNDVFAFGLNPRNGSLRVDAVAGSGKTTTMVELVKRLSAAGVRSIACAMFNKSAADHFGAKVGALQGVSVKTFHAFGYGAWGRQVGYDHLEQPDTNKTKRILAQTEVPEHFHEFVVKAVSLAKQRALGVLHPAEDVSAWYDIVAHFELEDTLGGWPTDEAIKFAQKTLATSNALCLPDGDRKGLIDFDDMIYAPLVHNARVWQNDVVIIDEAQDTNPARRALARKMLKAGGRLVAVGDPHQAIYGFTGADADSLDLIQKEFNCTRLPLTVSYRCPKAVVRHAQQVVSHIEAAPNAPEGAVEFLSATGFLALTPGKADAILCRNTAPLVDLAYGYIRRGVPCHVEGRDIGAGLLALATRWRIKSLSVLETKLEDHRTKQVSKLMTQGKELAAETLNDKIDTLLLIMRSLPVGSTTQDLRAAIEKLFETTPEGKAAQSLTLCTAHRSKGREWPTVYLYGRNKYMPSAYARQDWQAEQEQNLIYVAVTRAMERLVEVAVA